MKRAFAGLVLSSVLAAGAVRAADAVALAAQQEMLENYKRLTATMEELQTAQMAQQKQISALASDLGKLRDEVSRNNNSATVQESLRQLEKQILAVDKSRVDDNKDIQLAIERLGKAIKDMPAPPPINPRSRTQTEPVNGGSSTKSPANVSAGPEKGFEYTVQKGDSHLGVIVKRYRDENIPVTMQSIMKANPTVDWTRLQIGDKIFIPKPK
jgi:TolA-binding protein